MLTNSDSFCYSKVSFRALGLDTRSWCNDSKLSDIEEVQGLEGLSFRERVGECVYLMIKFNYIFVVVFVCRM